MIADSNFELIAYGIGAIFMIGFLYGVRAYNRYRKRKSIGGAYYGEVALQSSRKT